MWDASVTNFGRRRSAHPKNQKKEQKKDKEVLYPISEERLIVEGWREDDSERKCGRILGWMGVPLWRDKEYIIWAENQRTGGVETEVEDGIVS